MTEAHNTIWPLHFMAIEKCSAKIEDFEQSIKGITQSIEIDGDFKELVSYL